MHIVAAFFKSQTNGVTYDALSVVTDQSLTPAQSAGYLFPRNWRVFRSFVMGVNLTAARINAPSLRPLLLPEIVPALPSATVTTRPPIVDYGLNGPVIQQNEAVVIETSRGGADAQPVTGALFVGERFVPAPAGQVFTAVASFTNTLIAGNWTLSALTFNQTLPNGKYAVVGLEVVCGDAALARLVFPGFNQWRPGCVVDLAYGNMIQPSYFRMGNLGLYGEFYNTAQPQIEIFGLVAGAETGAAYIDLVKIGS